jgi:hypothetical protein
MIEREPPSRAPWRGRALLFLAAALLAMPALALEPWLTYRNARHGIEIVYPSGLLKPATAATEDGQLFTSTDERVRLLVGIIRNEEGQSLQAYREFLRQETYPGAEFDYTPSGQRWFVLSGRQGPMHFYQWVTFLCGGRQIGSFALTYPDAERSVLDRVVERMAKSFRPGGRDCD